MLERKVVGSVPKKHHLQHKKPSGGLYYEECLTRDGFDGPYSILYHAERPHTQRLARAEHGWALPQAAPERALAKRHYRSQDLARAGGAFIDARTPLLFNDDVV